jgi:antitoxin (DNA-binding transcriptional repressor) of toxin-antitoxin stability system
VRPQRGADGRPLGPAEQAAAQLLVELDARDSGRRRNGSDRAVSWRHHASFRKLSVPAKALAFERRHNVQISHLCTTMRILPCRILPLSELRASASAMLDLVERGEVVRMLRHGKPVADLVPIRTDAPLARPAWRRRHFEPLALPSAQSLANAAIEDGARPGRIEQLR